MKIAPPLLYADSDRSADMLYFGGFSVPDPYVAFEIEGKRYAILGALEYGRALKESSYDVVLSLEKYQELARTKARKGTAIGIAEVVMAVASELKQKAFTIPEDFPAGLATRLTSLGLKLMVCEGPIFPGREFKNKKETEAIIEGNRCAARGIAAAEGMLRASDIKDGKLYLKGEPLTSEKLKFAIEVACLEAGGLSQHTIVAGGDQACDPHCSGTGHLSANELIIIDVFPRVNATGFHGDMTRTFLRGRANEAQSALVEAVFAAQQKAIKAVKHGVNGRDVHRLVMQTFEDLGYFTKRSETGAVGFFHGTGHGLGLQVHELPRLSGAVDSLLQKGAVVTVEPGLYYPGLGACRIEDVVQVTAGKAKMLSDYHYEWELR